MLFYCAGKLVELYTLLFKDSLEIIQSIKDLSERFIMSSKMLKYFL